MASTLTLTPPALPDGLTLVETRDPAVLPSVWRLRVLAWRARMTGFPNIDAWTDAFDATARHWVVMEAGEPVAAARLSVHPTLAEAPHAELYAGMRPRPAGPAAAINRLVVHPRWAGRGLSHALDLVRIEAAREGGARYVIGVVRRGDPRVEALRALGFGVAGQAAAYRSGPLANLEKISLILMRPLS